MFYVLECKVNNCSAEFYLNDIPIIRRGPETGDSFGGPVNQFVVEGRNTLEMVIHPGPTPGEALGGADNKRKRFIPEEGAFAEAALTTYPKGAIIEGPDRKELVSLKWTAEPDAPYFFPTVRSVSCTLEKAFGSWKWLEAEKLTLDENTLQEANDFILNTHSTLSIGDYEAFADMGELRNEEIDRAYGKAKGASAQQLKTMGEMAKDESSWGMEQINPDRFSLRLCGDDRMIECLTKKWKPILEQLPDDQDRITRYQLMIGKLDGQWRILR